MSEILHVGHSGPPIIGGGGGFLRPMKANSNYVYTKAALSQAEEAHDSQEEVYWPRRGQ